MQCKKGTIFKCEACECELICITKCPEGSCKDGAPTCCCGQKMKKTCVPTCV